MSTLQFQSPAVTIPVQNYITKEFDEKGTDCKTNKIADVLLTENNYLSVLHRYIMVDEKPVLLELDNIKEYIGKHVKLRTPIFCQGKKICNVCRGEMV